MDARYHVAEVEAPVAQDKKRTGCADDLCAGPPLKKPSNRTDEVLLSWGEVIPEFSFDHAGKRIAVIVIVFLLLGLMIATSPPQQRISLAEFCPLNALRIVCS